MVVLQQMMKKLKLPLKGYKSVHNVSKNALSVFGKLQKTIIFTHGTTEANVISKYINDLGIKSLVSHSKIKGENPNDTFESFRNDSEVKVLVAVNRGKEGFDFPELYNVIDMTYSQNFEVVMQIFGRVLRKNKDIDMKYFFKVAPKNLSSYFVNWMNAMFMLFDMPCYSEFNGKNGFDIQIPNTLIQPKTKSARGGGKSTKGKIKPRNVEFFNSLSFMKENGWFKLDDTLATVASTSLRDVCVEFSMFKKYVWTYDKCKKEAKKYSTMKEFKKNASGAEAMVRKNNWIDDICSHMNITHTKWDKNTLKKEALKYKTKTEFSKRSAGAYVTARNMKIFDEITSHMIDGHNNKTKSIYQYDKSNNFIKKWNSVRDASRLLNIPHPNIINAANPNKTNKTAGGFIWKYKNENNSK